MLLIHFIKFTMADTMILHWCKYSYCNFWKYINKCDIYCDIVKCKLVEMNGLLCHTNWWCYLIGIKVTQIDRCSRSGTQRVVTHIMIHYYNVLLHGREIRVVLCEIEWIFKQVQLFVSFNLVKSEWVRTSDWWLPNIRYWC